MPTERFSAVEELLISFAYIKVAVGLPHCTTLQLCCHFTEVIVQCVLTNASEVLSARKMAPANVIVI